MIQFKESDLDKRDRIINAAFKEFGSQAFDKASTNSIVKNAKVSKGLLYHYFKSKEELYDYLIAFCFETVAETLTNQMDWTITDFFERLKDAMTIKMMLTRRYPHIYDFAIKYLSHLDEEAMDELYSKYSVDLLAKVYYENIDFSLFKEDIDTNRVIQMVQWTFEKYGDSIRLQDHFDMEVVTKEVDAYISMFKKAFYR